MSKPDTETIDETIRDLLEGDRVRLRWDSNRSHDTVDANGTVVADHEWDLRVDRDDRDSDLVVHLRDDGPPMLSSVYDDARTSLGDLLNVDVRNRGEASRRANPLTNASTTADLSDSAETIVLVGCGKAKADEPCAAKDLYTSNFASLKRQYAEEHGDEWAILSAEHGLLDPDAEIAPYDTTMDDVDQHEWELAVLEALPNVANTEIVLLAGPDYTDLKDDLFLYGADVELPTEGMKIGERMAWLSERVGDDDQEDEEDVDGRRSIIDQETIDEGPSAVLEELSETDGGGFPIEEVPTEPPEAPDDAPKYVREGLERQGDETLRAIAAYAERLADYKEADAERELEERAADVGSVPDEWDPDAWSDALEDSDAPANATLTEKPIDGRRYYYFQWRDGETITSEYVGPVSPSN